MKDLEELYFEVLKFGDVVSRNKEVVFGKVIHTILIIYDDFLFQVTRVDQELVDMISLGEVDE